MRNSISILALSQGLWLGGCGTVPQTDFAHALRSADGEVILFDQVRAILNDDALDAEQKREALRALGLEDERLIDALLEA
jgi:hypothetical protein